MRPQTYFASGSPFSALSRNDWALSVNSVANAAVHPEIPSAFALLGTSFSLSSSVDVSKYRARP
jgi:hypothetical protein